MGRLLWRQRGAALACVVALPMRLVTEPLVHITQESRLKYTKAIGLHMLDY